MAVKRAGAPYEIKHEQLLAGTRKFAFPTSGDISDASWQHAFRQDLGKSFASGLLAVDERTLHGLEFRSDAVIFNLRVDQLDALPTLLDAVEAAIQAAGTDAAAKRDSEERAAAQAKAAKEEADREVERALGEWNQTHSG